MGLPESWNGRSLWAERTDGSSVLGVHIKRSKVWVRGPWAQCWRPGGTVWVCYQGIVMISWLSYFSLISPAPHFPFFSAGWPWEGEGHIRTAMALLQTVIYGRPSVCLSPHEIKDDLGRNTQPWGSRTVSSFLGLKMFYPTLPFCIMPG